MDQRWSLVQLGSYQLTGRCLGKGSFAKVYEAVHRQLKTTVALKTVNIADMKDGYMKRNFKREALLLSQLNHPAIVALFEVIETKNFYCMALEFGGENLCDFVRVQSRGRLEEITARIMARQLTSAVDHLHKRGVIHRDIKLENILVNPESKKVKLTDFGLGNCWDQKTLLTTQCGSPEYAAPEVHLGKSYGAEVDIWALGVVLFGMVVGRLPFEVGMKKPVSNQHRRELFLEETKRGVKTMKHQTFMGSASFLFKDLISKMLNPNRQLRLTIGQVESHHWIFGAFVEEFPPVDERWKRKAFQKYAKLNDLSMANLADQLSTHPFGQLGGVYNIEKHSHQLSKITLKKAPIRELERSISKTASAISRPTTSIDNQLKSTHQRPTTTQGKAGTLKTLNTEVQNRIMKLNQYVQGARGTLKLTQVD